MTLRILALGGYGQNATGFARQCAKALLGGKPAGNWEALPAGLQKLSVNEPAEDGMLGQVKGTSPSGAEITFLDPTVVLSKDLLMPVHIAELESYAEFPNPASRIPRAWWTAPDRNTYKCESVGWDRVGAWRLECGSRSCTVWMRLRSHYLMLGRHHWRRERYHRGTLKVLIPLLL